MGEKSTIELEIEIRATAAQIRAALTDGTQLQKWLCDQAWVEPWVGGRYTLRWHSGYEVQGTFVEIDDDEIVLTWHGIGAPGPTVVEWELEEEDDAVELELEHAGFGPGVFWEQARSEAEKGWREALENLRAILEKGRNPRDAQQPILGIDGKDLTPELAEREEIDAESGVYVTTIYPDSAAHAAGLQVGDVIVGLAGRAVSDIASFVAAMQATRAGETIGIELLHGSETLTVEATLQARSLASVPDEPAAAAAQLRGQHRRINAALAEAVAGLSKDQATQRPVEGEWSVNETLAHLSICEHGLHESIGNLFAGLRSEGTGNPTVWPPRLAAVLAVDATVPALLARFAGDQEETALLIEQMTAEAQSNRYDYHQAVQLAFAYVDHTDEHIEQIRRAIAALQAAAKEAQEAEEEAEKEVEEEAEEEGTEETENAVEQASSEEPES